MGSVISGNGIEWSEQVKETEQRALHPSGNSVPRVPQWGRDKVARWVKL